MRTKNIRNISQLVALVAALIVIGLVAATTEAQSRRHYLSVVMGGEPAAASCDLPNTQYSSLPINGSPLTVNPESDENVNLGYRGYAPVDAPRKLVELGPVHDRKAPQFPGLFADWRVPTITGTYQRYRWDEGCDCPLDTYSRWETTVLGMGVTPGETIYTPDSGYDIGDGYEYLVMYAAESRVTLHIGREDEFFGYILHIEDVCVDPDLVALYRQLHAAGRRELPVLRGHHPFGKALGEEIKIAARDWGSFIDPRSRNDWWQGR